LFFEIFGFPFKYRSFYCLQVINAGLEFICLEQIQHMPKVASIFIIFINLLFPVHGEMVLHGKILDGNGSPVKGARMVSVEDREVLALSGPDGLYSFESESLPEEICVSHPGFESLNIKIDPALFSGSSRELEITLRDKPELSEEITVTATVPLPGFAPVAAASATVEPHKLSEIPAALLDVVRTVPGVSANGQGGMFQTYSIRGVARHRVKSSILSARLAGERRAGVSASFIDPFLFGSVDVLKGPSSSYHGSGALGGAVRITPRRFDGYALELGYGSRGNEVYSASGWGNENWSAGIVRKEAGDSEAPDGTVINSHFTQYSGLLSRFWEIKGGTAEFILMPSMGLSIGKASTDFHKGKVTEYPTEKHVVAHMLLKLDSGWDISGFFHPHSVATEVRKNGNLTRVDTNSYDSGVNVRKHLYQDDRTMLSMGGEYFSRAGVDSVENQWSSLSPAPSVPFYSLDGASRNEASLSGDIRRDIRDIILEGGIRYTLSRQSNSEMESLENTAWNSYGGIVIPVNQGLKFKGSLGTGLRFPTLSELFYRGTTGRGSVEGNSSLVPERAFILESGLEWMGPKFVFSTSLFRNRINDYIERVVANPVAAPDHFTYRNLTSGTINGLEWELAASPLIHLELVWRGHLMKGRDDLGNSLADIPAHRSSLGARYIRRNWSGGLNWQYRSSINDPGPGEKTIGSAGLIDGYIKKSITRELDIILSGANLSNEEYYSSADAKVPLSAGRSVTVSLRWKLPGSGQQPSGRMTADVK